MSNIINSLTRYYNTLINRKGPVFLPQFHSRMIISDEQLMHVSRYIHLNPYSSQIIMDVNQLKKYHYSSYSQYVDDLQHEDLCDTNTVLSLFRGNREGYRSFVEQNAQYQLMLEECKYIKKWK